MTTSAPTRWTVHPEARQAAAADERFVYVVDNKTVSKYDRATGKRIADSHGGDPRHMNSAFLHQGKLYCAESNYLDTPEHSRIMRLDPDKMKLAELKEFDADHGSLTWCVHDHACEKVFWREEFCGRALQHDRTQKRVHRRRVAEDGRSEVHRRSGCSA